MNYLNYPSSPLPHHLLLLLPLAAPQLQHPHPVTVHTSISSVSDSPHWAHNPLLYTLPQWYSRTFHATCYFKSTDGHNNNWSFNTSRLNLHVAQLAGQKGGCFIVDATRKGKQFPDSMSKTIPIWTCVLNRSIRNHRERMRQSSVVHDGVSLEKHKVRSLT